MKSLPSIALNVAAVVVGVTTGYLVTPAPGITPDPNSRLATANAVVPAIKTAPSAMPVRGTPDPIDPTSQAFIPTVDQWIAAICQMPDTPVRTETLREMLRFRALYDPVGSLGLARKLKAMGFAVSVASPLIGWTKKEPEKALAWSLQNEREVHALPASEFAAVSHALQQGTLFNYSDHHLTSSLPEATASVAPRLVARWSNPAEREKIAQEIATHPDGENLRRLLFQQLGHRASLDALGWLQQIDLETGEKRQIAAAFLQKSATESGGAMSVAALRAVLSQQAVLKLDEAYAAVATGAAIRDADEASVFAAAIQDAGLRTSVAAKTALVLSATAKGDPEKFLNLVSWPNGDDRHHNLYALVSAQMIAHGRASETVSALISRSPQLTAGQKQALIARLGARPAP